MTTLLTCDPGSHKLALAMFDRRRLTHVDVIEGDTLDDMRLAAAFVRSLKPFDRAIVEQPAIYDVRRWRGDPNDLITVAIVAGMLLGFVRATKVETVKPSVWKGQTPKKIDHQRTLDELSPKERELLDHLPKKTRGDILDAVGIGLWALGRK